MARRGVVRSGSPVPDSVPGTAHRGSADRLETDQGPAPGDSALSRVRRRLPGHAGFPAGRHVPAVRRRGDRADGTGRPRSHPAARAGRAGHRARMPPCPPLFTGPGGVWRPSPSRRSGHHPIQPPDPAACRASDTNHRASAPSSEQNTSPERCPRRQFGRQLVLIDFLFRIIRTVLSGRLPHRAVFDDGRMPYPRRRTRGRSRFTTAQDPPRSGRHCAAPVGAVRRPGVAEACSIPWPAYRTGAARRGRSDLA